MDLQTISSIKLTNTFLGKKNPGNFEKKKKHEILENHRQTLKLKKMVCFTQHFRTRMMQAKNNFKFQPFKCGNEAEGVEWHPQGQTVKQSQQLNLKSWLLSLELLSRCDIVVETEGWRVMMTVLALGNTKSYIRDMKWAPDSSTL